MLSVGSAIMGPQVFEKSLSCVNNLRLQDGRPIVRGHTIYVVDLQDGGGWDWTQGEPPKTNPAYYLRFCKSYSRMGGAMHYCNATTWRSSTTSTGRSRKGRMLRLPRCCVSYDSSDKTPRDHGHLPASAWRSWATSVSIAIWRLIRRGRKSPSRPACRSIMSFTSAASRGGRHHPEQPGGPRHSQIFPVGFAGDDGEGFELARSLGRKTRRLPGPFR